MENYGRDSTKKKQLDLNSRILKDKKQKKIRFFRHSLFFIIFVLFLGLAAGGVVIYNFIADAPKLSEISLSPSKQKSIVYDKDGEVITELSNYQSNRIIIDSEQIPEYLKNAFVAIEDARFYKHNGVDLKGIIRAIFSNIKSLSLKEGASTITQQLIKNNIFDTGDEKTTVAKIKRKIQEQYLAIKVEQLYTKDEILTNYLNTINLGQGVFGVQAAAKLYFNKDAKNLTLSESAVLASITKSPSNLDPIEHPEENKSRRALVLRNMLELNFISEEEYQEALADDVYSRIQSLSNSDIEEETNSYFVDALVKNLVQELKTQKKYTEEEAYQLIYGGGLKIYSTQDTEIQNIAVDIIDNPEYYPDSTKVSLTYRLTIVRADGIEENYSEYDVQSYFRTKNNDPDYDIIYKNQKKARKACDTFKKSVTKSSDQSAVERFSVMLQPQASFTLIEQETGEVRALVGGSNRESDDDTIYLNRAVETTRQPGSTFKILSTYLPGIDRQIFTLATVFDDAPYEYEDIDKEVQNWDGEYKGFTTVRDAIKDSVNVVAAKAIMKSTPQSGFDYLTSLGFTTLVERETDSDGNTVTDIIQPLALGGITNGVTNLELTAAYAAIANEGQYISPTLYTKVLDSDGNVVLESAPEKKKVMRSSTSWLLTNAMQDVVEDGTGTAAALSSDMPVAGKTGTTSNDVDFWFAGYTPYYTASIWMGYDINKTFSNKNFHKKIWKKIMDEVIEEKELEVKDFPDCDDIVSVKICAKSGKLAINGVCDHEIDPDSSSGIKNEIRTEYFVKGTQPKEYCDSHVKVTLCKESDLPVNKSCPKSDQYTRVYLVQKETAQLKTLDADKLLPPKYEEETCDVDHSLLNKIISSLTGDNKNKNQTSDDEDDEDDEKTSSSEKNTDEDED